MDRPVRLVGEVMGPVGAVGFAKVRVENAPQVECHEPERRVDCAPQRGLPETGWQLDGRALHPVIHWSPRAYVHCGRRPAETQR